jgi:hypothetical protein
VAKKLEGKIRVKLRQDQGPFSVQESIGLPNQMPSPSSVENRFPNQIRVTVPKSKKYNRPPVDKFQSELTPEDREIIAEDISREARKLTEDLIKLEQPRKLSKKAKGSARSIREQERREKHILPPLDLSEDPFKYYEEYETDQGDPSGEKRKNIYGDSPFSRGSGGLQSIPPPSLLPVPMQQQGLQQAQPPQLADPFAQDFVPFDPQRMFAGEPPPPVPPPVPMPRNIPGPPQMLAPQQAPQVMPQGPAPPPPPPINFMRPSQRQRGYSALRRR